MSKPSYWELLKHPKWQEKRLRIMERAGFACEQCDSKDQSLNVHHAYYEKDAMPWEYPDDSLHCLCEQCHEQAEVLRLALRRVIGLLPLSDAWTVLGFAKGLEMAEWPYTTHKAENYEVLEGMVRAVCRVNLREICNLTNYVTHHVMKTDGEIDGIALHEICNGKP